MVLLSGDIIQVNRVTVLVAVVVMKYVVTVMHVLHSLLAQAEESPAPAEM